MTTNQVCLVIMFQGIIDRIYTFTQDQKGIKQCEDKFFQMVKEYCGENISAVNVDEFIDNYGYDYEDNKYLIQMIFSF